MDSKAPMGARHLAAGQAGCPAATGRFARRRVRCNPGHMKVADPKTRVQAAAEMRRQLGDRPARIKVDGIEVSDAEIEQEIQRENDANAKAEANRYQSTLKEMFER